MEFGEDYYINSKISNYQDYTKKKYGDLCNELIELLSMKKDDNILDRGCATGNLVREFVYRHYNIKGSDISKWAIDYGRKNGLYDNLEYYNPELINDSDIVIMNDVLEHACIEEIRNWLGRCTSKIILRVPICANEGEDYVLECSRVDKTHIQRHTRGWWINLFKEHGYSVEEIYGKHIYSSDGVLACILTKGDIH